MKEKKIGMFHIPMRHFGTSQDPTQLFPIEHVLTQERRSKLRSHPRVFQNPQREVMMLSV